jgi:hypothetical protein
VGTFWYGTTVFDAHKFHARYGISENDYDYIYLNGEHSIRLHEGVILPDDPPVFDPPDPPAEPTTREELLVALVGVIARGRPEFDKVEMLDLFRKLLAV